ncbi:MAG TPA: type II toxin-antitoxin system PemK/MazF family toxin [Terriglobia bacterium]|nr:type II toxin-antitoxin system PemK/MazF family toxin [Terriglobia bacterium]
MSTSSIFRGDVVLVPFPFTDLAGSALRPAFVVSPTPIGQDVILAAISSVVRGDSYPTDCLVPSAHAEFANTGLRVTSVVRLHKLVTVEEGVVVRRLGRFGPRLSAEVDRLLRVALGL